MSPVINKFLVALITAAVTLQLQLAETKLAELTAVQIITIVVAFAGALGVYTIPNATKSRG